MYENIEKINLTITVSIPLSLNMDMVLKYKLNHLVLTEFLKIFFKSCLFVQKHGGKWSKHIDNIQLSFSSRVLTLSRDIGHDFENLVFTGENLTLFTFITNAHYSTYRNQTTIDVTLF